MAVVERRAAGAVEQTIPASSERGVSALWRRNATALLFMAPAAIMVILFFLVPVLLTLGMGMTDMSTATGLSKWQWIGTDNFERIFSSAFTRIIFLNTVFYVTITLGVSVLSGLAIAILST